MTIVSPTCILLEIFLLSVTTIIQELRSFLLHPGLRVWFIISHERSLQLMVYNCVCSRSHLVRSGSSDSKRRGTDRSLHSLSPTHLGLLVLEDLEPDPSIFCNPSRLSVVVVENQPRHKKSRTYNQPVIPERCHGSIVA